MAGKTVILMPDAQQKLNKMGNNIKKARLRRNISIEVLAESARISKGTLYAIEKGTATVSIGAYVAVLTALGMDKDLELVAKDDEFGRRLQDMNLVAPKRAKRK